MKTEIEKLEIAINLIESLLCLIDDKKTRDKAIETLNNLKTEVI